MDLVSLGRGLLGMAVLLALAFAFSNNKRRVDWRLVGIGILIQIVLAVFLLRGDDMATVFSPLGWPRAFFDGVSYFFGVKMLEAVNAGAGFMFGPLALSPGEEGSLGGFFAFQVLPTIVFFAALTSVLYHLGVLQLIVKGLAWAVSRALRTSGAESLSVVADIFVGQTEAPLVIRPYLKGMTQSELLGVMAGGMATIAGGVLVAYIQILGGAFAEAQGMALDPARVLFARQLLAASVMAAPAAILFSKILIPETEVPETMGKVRVPVERTEENVIGAAAAGASDGLKLALNVGAMLVAFVALIALINIGLDAVAGLFGYTTSLEMIFGVVFAPVAWVIGVPWVDAVEVGSLLGTKVVLNEFVAYLSFGEMVGANALSAKSITIATFALCGFANFSSIAIQIGGTGSLAPERVPDLVRLGIRALFAGTLANLLTATIAGVVAG
ncbi:MAG TPA: nucleoside transporter C-terminal domain-containing protein [Rubricoccaceae bacterium]